MKHSAPACLVALATAARLAAAQPESEPADASEGTGEAAVPRGAAGAVIVPAERPGPKKPVRVTMPQQKRYSAPRYPAEAERAGAEGEVVLALDIDKEGKVSRALVSRPGGHGFDEAAVEAARGLLFEPARLPDGKPVPSRILYRYVFALRPAPAGPGPQAPAAARRAPASTFSGTVAAGPDAPLAGASVTVTLPDGSERTATTAAGGGFSFAGLGAGKLRVAVTAAGFEPLALEEELGAGEAVGVRYRLRPEARPEGGLEVVVEGERPPREITRRTLSREEIDRIPGTGGDALRSLQSLPGVARSPGMAGMLVVRGSAPADTQIFVDGTPVPLIYHFGGLASVVPTESIEKIDFYPGNFSARYGRGMGGIVEVGLRAPKEDRKLHGVAQLDFIDARLLAEGPVPYVPGLTFLAAGRRSWVDAWLGPVLEAVGANVTQAPVYYDYQFVLDYRPSRRARLRTSFFGSDDAFEILLDRPPENEPAMSGDFGMHTAFQRLQVVHESRPSESDRLRWVTALGRDKLDFAFGPFFLLVDTYSLTSRIELAHRFSRRASLNVGTDLEMDQANVTLRVPAMPPAGQPPGQPFSTRPPLETAYGQSFLRPAVYAEAELVPTARLRLVPGVRLDYVREGEQIDASPRLNARYDLAAGFPRTTVKAGVGLFHQPPAYQESTEPFGTSGLPSNRAVHYGLGMEQEVTRRIEASVEGFVKDMDRLVVRSATEASAYTNLGTGYAVGGEVMLKYKPDEHFFGWLAYTVSRAVRESPGVPERLAWYDQPHNLTLVGSLKLGRGYELGARFRLGSGRLHTPVVCDPESAGCDPKRINALLHAASGVYVELPYGERGSERLPLFHQLDLRMDKTWRFSAWKLSLYVDVQNVYASPNVEGIRYNYNYTERLEMTGLPFLPSLGLRGEM